MHKFVYGGVAAAMALLVAGALLSAQQVRVANAEQVSGIMNIRAIESTIDMKALPASKIKDMV